MGYTHYWTQTRNFSKDEWQTVMEDMAQLFSFVQHEMGVPLADGMGDAGTSPKVNKNSVRFNGLGDDSHETMCIDRLRPKLEKWQKSNQRGWGFCKTARKPYDPIVTATLCYLATIMKTHSVSSDGQGSDFVEGLEIARRAWPRYANMIDIPMDVMRADRWCSPYVNMSTKKYQINFCRDGHGYIMRGDKELAQDCLYFDTHLALAKWLNKTKDPLDFEHPRDTEFGTTPGREMNLWSATGLFDKQRYKRLERLQEAAIGDLYMTHQIRKSPPAFARPGQMPEPENAPYDFQNLLKNAVEGKEGV